MTEAELAILTWCQKNRPDLSEMVEKLFGQHSTALLMGIAFEAGRCFQDVNPTCPLGPIPIDGDWKPILEN